MVIVNDGSEQKEVLEFLEELKLYRNFKIIDLDKNKPELTKLITDTPDDMFEAFEKAGIILIKENST